MGTPTRLARRVVPLLTLFVLGLASLLRAEAPGSAQERSPLALEARVDVGGRPGPIVVDHWGGRNDVVFYDQSNSTVRFLNGETLTLAPEELSLPSWSWKDWLIYDRHLHRVYVVTTRLRSGWVEGRVHALSARSVAATISINSIFNEGLADPPDATFELDGVAYKQSYSEGGNGGRLFVDCSRCGIVSVLDFDAMGTDAVGRQRFTYRDRLEGTIMGVDGNTLALETRHETLAADDLVATDLLYLYDIMDPDFPAAGRGQVQVFSVGHGALGLQRLPDVDLNDTWPFANGMQGLAVAGGRDILYVSSGMGSFEKGYVAEVDTTTNEPDHVVQLLYMDQEVIEVNWYDPRYVFVATADEGWNDPALPLNLHLIYNGMDVASLHLGDGYKHGDLRGMAFDPYSNRLYVTLGTEIVVVQVNYGLLSPTSASARIETAGGSLMLPDSSVRLDFPAGAVAQAVDVTCTALSSPAAGALVGLRHLDLVAVEAGTDTFVSDFAVPYAFTVSYDEAELAGIVEESLALYWWDGSQWQREATSSLDAAGNRVTATLDHMSLFAVLGEPASVLVPLVQ